MTTALLAVSVIGNLFALIFVIGARQAAKDAVVDTLRINGLIEHRFTVTPAGDEPEWGVLQNGVLICSNLDLRAALDQADNEVADHG